MGEDGSKASQTRRGQVKKGERALCAPGMLCTGLGMF